MISLMNRLILPILVLGFVAAFQLSVLRLSAESKLMPQTVLVLLTIACLYSILRDLLLWRAGRTTELGPGGFSMERETRRIALIALITAVYVFVIDIVGFYPATGGFLAGAYLLIGPVSWLAVPYVAVTVGIIFVVFELGLGVLLPGA
ncbi:MAG: hypothetical protein CMF72_19820 [Mameliella sp.]|nr:hypothetical protein [Mameliella sp.]|tara:strand:+ start:2434 stop:2877 length:444 start_codon:yes stop_codon:yes gene_type:complete